MINPTKRLAALGLKLPIPTAPLAAYIPVTRSGNLLFISGQISQNENGVIKGCLGVDIKVTQAREAARRAALGVLAQIVYSADVPLENVEKILKLTVFVASAPDFFEHHLVANGASELIGDVLGEKGKHARAAFGVAALPMGAVVEIEAIVQVANSMDMDR